jgi:protoporphyrinogen oxidase
MYDRLVSTLPLPEFVGLVPDAPAAVRAAARALDCTELLLVDVFAPKVMESDYRWFYVYDEDKLATRIHCVESLAPANAPAGMTGVQVEVYSSRHRPAAESPATVAARVAEELVELGFVAAADLRAGRVTVGWRMCPYANVMFTHPRRDALDTIYGWLEEHGLARETDDLAPATDWTANPPAPRGSVVMAGRFAQWKYFWTDDCVLRGRQIAAADRGPA